MESSLLAGLIQTLAGIQQHCGLVALCAEQGQQLRALLAAQAEDRNLLQMWVQRTDARAAATAANNRSNAPTRPLLLTLAKTWPQDDVEALIELFERTAEALGCPRSEWVVQLIPLLSAAVQLAVQQLLVTDMWEYPPTGGTQPGAAPSALLFHGAPVPAA